MNLGTTQYTFHFIIELLVIAGMRIPAFFVDKNSCFYRVSLLYTKYK